jgi:hypothetical protein
MSKKLTEIIKREGIDPKSLGPFFETTETKIYSSSVPGAQAIESWRRLWQQVPVSQYWPVLLGGEESCRLLKEQLAQEPRKSFEKTTNELLAEVSQLPIDPRAWQRQRTAAMVAWMKKNKDIPASIVEMLEATLEQRPSPEKPAPKPWPDEVRPIDNFTVPYNPYDSQKLLDSLSIGLVPTQTSWQVPAFLRFGGFNACPFPAEHAAILKHWEERYGTELVSMTHNTIELAVAKPVTKKEEALELADLHLDYCGDLLQVMYGSKNSRLHLAARLLGAKVWYFWWD